MSRLVYLPAKQRRLSPRTPDDCPICRQQAAHPAQTAVPPAPIIPWRERKSRRGRPKRITTQGFACPNRTCAYYQIRDAQFHALVGDGVDGTCERIQSLRCQACNTTFSTRRDALLYRLKIASLRVAEVLTALAEGVDIAAATRIFGHRHATITTWLSRAGEHSATLHDHFFRRLHLPHLQLDELRTRLRNHTQILWLWVAVDPLSKIMVVLHLGARTQDAAHRVIHDLCQRLAPECMPVFTSDGLKQYFYALTAHFGQWIKGVGRRADQWQVAAGLLYGQVKKHYRRDAPGTSDACAALRNAYGAQDYIADSGLEWATEHRVCRTRELDAAAERGGPGSSDMVDRAGRTAAAAACGLVARRPITLSGLLSRCACCWPSQLTVVTSASPSAIDNGLQQWLPD